jgi:streptogramin lyase
LRNYPVVLFVPCILLAGCASAPVLTSNSTPTGPVRGAAISGRVHGGQSAISGAHVYLLAVNNTGYGGPGIPASGSNASVSLLTTGSGQDSIGYYVTTASDGSFSISGDYTCPSSYAIPYLYAAGGNAGSGNNSAITLVGPVGSCPTSSEYVIVNEVTTVAAVYAFAGFSSSPINVSSSNTALAGTGLSNAGTTLNNLVKASTGVANTTTAGGNGTVPQSTIDTLANILAACINSSGSTSMQCSTLLNNAENGTTPAPDTATAALNIAHNPGANVGNLFGLQAASAPFIPDLPSMPNDFTIAIAFTGGGMEIPYDVAIDGRGNVWVANQAGKLLSELTPGGTPVSATGYNGGGLNTSYAIAVDSVGNVWVAGNESANTNSTLSEFNSSGSPLSGSGFTGGGLNTPRGMTIDKSGNIWITDRYTTEFGLSEFDSSGSSVAGSPFIGGGISYPWGIAADLSGNLWVADRFTTGDAYGTDLSEFTASTGAANSHSPITGGGLGQPVGVAVDASGNIWVSDQTNSNDISTDEGAALSEFNSSGTAITGADGYTGGGMTEPDHIAIDGAGRVWVADYASSSICEFSSSGTAISGGSGHGYSYGTGLLGEPWGLAIDLSGNLWVPVQSGGSNAIVEFVGVAAPVVTPMVANLLTPYGGHAVNLP